MEVFLRQEINSDFPEVYDLNLLAFGEKTEANLVNALRKNQDAFIPKLSIVATKENKIVGHILFTKIKIKNNFGGTHNSLALAPMAVLPEHQKQGIGGQLITKGFTIAKNLNYKSIIVLGHENYYPKFGFRPAKKWNIKSPFKVPSNVFMALELEKDGLKNISGTVIYAKEFNIH